MKLKVKYSGEHRNYGNQREEIRRSITRALEPLGLHLVGGGPAIPEDGTVTMEFSEIPGEVSMLISQLDFSPTLPLKSLTDFKPAPLDRLTHTWWAYGCDFS